MNRGTQNDLITFRDGAVTFCAVTPPGQSGFVGPDGGKSPHHDDQMALYGRFACRPQALLREDVLTVARDSVTFVIGTDPRD
ncbi:hypothetical protein [Paracoccus fontiphilus]|uniref:Uncharacterized protein n=1 Tax=Paracoccus fontiphilus TaxID=1815556 RepID=A0ABV7IGL3_9RHOB